VVAPQEGPQRAAPAVLVLVLLLAEQVRLGDDAGDAALAVHDGHAADAVLGEHLGDLGERGLLGHGHHVLGHDVLDRAAFHVSSWGVFAVLPPSLSRRRRLRVAGPLRTGTFGLSGPGAHVTARPGPRPGQEAAGRGRGTGHRRAARTRAGVLSGDRDHGFSTGHRPPGRSGSTAL